MILNHILVFIRNVILRCLFKLTGYSLIGTCFIISNVWANDPIKNTKHIKHHKSAHSVIHTTKKPVKKTKAVKTSKPAVKPKIFVYEQPKPIHMHAYSKVKWVKKHKPHKIAYHNPLGFYVSGGAVASMLMANGTNMVSTGPGWPDDTYKSQRVTGQPGLFLAGGYTWKRDTKWLPAYSVGMKYMYTSPATVKGYIDQYSIPNFENYYYTYQIQQQNLLATVKADLYNWRNVMPYLTLGAGLSINAVSSYQEQALTGVTPRLSPAFSSRINTNFAYTVGAGFDFILQKNIWMNLEYDYAYYGTVRTGRGADNTSFSGSNFADASIKNRITANTIFLGFTYYPE